MSTNAARLTIYAYITSIEADLRGNLIKLMGNEIALTESLGKDIFDKAFQRLQKERGEAAYIISLSEIVDYLDFGDAIQVLSRNKKHYLKEIAADCDRVNAILTPIIVIRNRVMHSRPLEIDDLPVVIDAIESCTKLSRLDWSAYQELILELRRNPSYVFGLRLPVSEKPTIPHNLPIPDFDETGFLGRADDEKALRNLVMGAYPVITVVGEGGLGKTALALKVAYAILDQTPSKFDSIVWCTAKTTSVTTKEVQSIRDAITTSFGVFKAIASTLSGAETESPVDEIVSYLAEFKILLILDNLETVKDKAMEDFFARLPAGSKVLVTSRVGLGDFERRLRLDALKQTESVRLMQVLAREPKHSSFV